MSIYVWTPSIILDSDTTKGIIINADSKEVQFIDTRIEDFTCFDADNVIDLKYNIDRLKLKRGF